MNNLQRIYLWLIFLICPLLHETGMAKYVLALLVFSIIISDFLLTNNYYAKRLSRILLAFSLYFLWSIWILINKGAGSDGYLRLMQIMGCIGTFYLGATIKWEMKALVSVYNVICVLLFFMLVFWAVTSRDIFKFSFIYANANTYASFLFAWFLFIFNVRPNRPLCIVLCLTLLSFTGSRSALLCSILYISLLFFLNKWNNSKDYTLIFVICITILIGFVFLYPTLMLYGFGQHLDSISQDFFDKGLETGRQYIWRDMFEIISTSIWTGFGLSATPLLVDETRSCHNTFIQQALQSGIVGLGLLITVLYSIYSMNKHIQTRPLKNSLVSVVLVIISHECFEVCLTQNCFAVGLMLWMIMGMCCNVHYMDSNNLTQLDGVF